MTTYSNQELTTAWLSHIKNIIARNVDKDNHSDRWEKEHSHNGLLHPQPTGAQITEAKQRTRNLHLRHLIIGFAHRCATKFSDSTVAGDVSLYTTKEKIYEFIVKLQSEMEIPSIEWWHKHDAAVFHEASTLRKFCWSKEVNGVITPDLDIGIFFISPSVEDVKLLEVGYNKMRGATA